MQIEIVLGMLMVFSMMLFMMWYMLRSCKDGKRNVEGDDDEVLEKKYSNVNTNEDEDALEMV